jgi:Uma2 family endonuclease
MTANLNYYYISAEDYLEGERISPIKHEYIRGEIYAMAGASKAHGIVAGNLFSILKNHLRGSSCTTYMADIKVRIETADVYYYPDITVTGDRQDSMSLNEDFIRYPRLVIEVLSPTTAAFDRGDKFADYRTIESLEEYVLVNQEKMGVECFRRNSEGLWVLYPYKIGEKIHLASIDLRFSIETIYEDMIGIV